MIILNYYPLDLKEADVFLREDVYVSVAKNIELLNETGHLVHTITAKED